MYVLFSAYLTQYVIMCEVSDGEEGEGEGERERALNSRIKRDACERGTVHICMRVKLRERSRSTLRRLSRPSSTITTHELYTVSNPLQMYIPSSAVHTH